ncbi:hypothetical protein ABKN59_001563 [Abortiporus biennis]
MSGLLAALSIFGVRMTEQPLDVLSGATQFIVSHGTLSDAIKRRNVEFQDETLTVHLDSTFVLGHTRRSADLLERIHKLVLPYTTYRSLGFATYPVGEWR